MQYHLQIAYFVHSCTYMSSVHTLVNRIPSKYWSAHRLSTADTYDYDLAGFFSKHSLLDLGTCRYATPPCREACEQMMHLHHRHFEGEIVIGVDSLGKGVL